MRISSIVAGASAAMVVLQAAYCATRGETFLLRPPGAHGESDFSAHCIKCGACMQACPYLAIRPRRQRRGHGCGARRSSMHVLRPAASARTSPASQHAQPAHCATSTSVPTSAWASPSSTRTPASLSQGMRCEVCYRVCPLIDKAIAIDYRLREGDAIHSVFAPVIDEKQCVGCGLCVERCVVSEPEVPIRIATDAERADGGEALTGRCAANRGLQERLRTVEGRGNHGRTERREQKEGCHGHLKTRIRQSDGRRAGKRRSGGNDVVAYGLLKRKRNGGPRQAKVRSTRPFAGSAGCGCRRHLRGEGTTSSSVSRATRTTSRIAASTASKGTT